MNVLRARYAAQADPLRSERRVELAVLGCAAVLLLLLIYLLLRILLATDIAPIAPAPDSVRVATLAGGGALPVQEREALLARPLFWAGRQPESAAAGLAVVTEAEASSEAAPRMKDVTLQGVYGSGKAGGVILSVKQRQLRVAVGDEVEGWRLERVTGDSAVFVSGGKRDERELVPQLIEPPKAMESADSTGSPARRTIKNGNGAEPVIPGALSDAVGEEAERRLTLGGRR